MNSLVSDIVLCGEICRGCTERSAKGLAASVEVVSAGSRSDRAVWRKLGVEH